MIPFLPLHIQLILIFMILCALVVEVQVQRKNPLLKKLISIFVAALCASSSAFIYDTTTNPGHSEMDHWVMAGVAGFAAIAWAWFVFPKMGKSIFKDILWIAAAFPCVGALAGFSLPPGNPIGIAIGSYIAVTLPFIYPAKILPLYTSGAVLAFILPRIGQRP